MWAELYSEEEHDSHDESHDSHDESYESSEDDHSHEHGHGHDDADGVHFHDPAWFYGELSIAMAFLLVGFALVWYRRKYFPLSGRHLPLAFTATISLSLGLLVLDLYSIEGLYCSWLRILSQCLGIVSANAIFLRVFRVWALFSIALQKLQLSKQTSWNENSAKANYYSPDQHRNDNDNDSELESGSGSEKSRSLSNAMHWKSSRHWRFASNKFLRKVFAWTSVIPVAILVVTFGVFSATHDIDAGDQSCLPSEVTKYTTSTYLIAIVLATFAVLFQARQIRDNYGIKHELIAIMAMITITVVFQYLEGAHEVFHKLHWAPIVGMYFIMFYYPVYLTYREERQKYRRHHRRRSNMASSSSRTNESVLRNTSLLTVLTDNAYVDARESFELHLVNEFSVENIVFFKATLQFERLYNDMSDKEARDVAVQLYMEFVHSDGPYEVNLPYNITNQITADLERCCDDFEAAQNAYIQRRVNRGDSFDASLERPLNQPTNIGGVVIVNQGASSSLATECSGSEKQNVGTVRYQNAGSSNENDDRKVEGQSRGTRETSASNDGDGDASMISELEGNPNPTEIEMADLSGHGSQSSTALSATASASASAGETIDDSSRSRLQATAMPTEPSRRRVARPPQDTFKTARTAIVSLMEADTFMRWKTAYHRKLKKAAEEAPKPPKTEVREAVEVDV